MPKQKPKRVSKRPSKPPRRYTPTSRPAPAVMSTPAASSWMVTPHPQSGIHQGIHQQSPILRVQPTEPNGAMVQQLERRIQELENSLNSSHHSTNPHHMPHDGEQPRANYIASYALPLHTTLDREVAAKISDGEFIPMTAITPNPNPDHKKSESKPLTVTAWARGYIRLMSHQIHHNLASAQDMLVHMDNVLALAQDRHQWTTYDADFRRQQVNAGYTYAHTRIELYSKAIARSQPFRPTQHPPSRRPGGALPPAGYCYKFHSQDQRCDTNPCPYSHKCPKCGSIHPQFACYRSKPQKPDQQDQEHKDKKSTK